MSTPSNLGKSLSAQSPASHSTAPPASISSSSFESTRRPAQVSPSYSQSIPRKGQAARKQHRNQKKAGASRDPSRVSVRVDNDDAMAEIRAVRNASSRRGQTSITHLMNYALPARHYLDTHSNTRSYRRNPTWGPGSGYHAADKTRYVNANYRFVVSPKGNYSSQAADADEHLDWSDVLQVLASTESQATSCPICLSEPVAPRMAKCGHIFCLSCLIRFMNSSSNDDAKGPALEKKAKWKKCPICEDSIYISETRPVRFYAGQESPLPRPGDDVVLRLMMRNAHSTLALPREGGVDVLNSGEEIPWHFAANVLDYARIMKGTSGYMRDEYDREIQDLLRQEKEDELLFHEDNEWTQRAIKAITAAKEKVRDLGEVEVALASAAVKSAPPNSGRQPDHEFYFYTSPPHLYLSPLDIRILKTKYGSFDQLPSTLLPRVEHISTGHSVDDALRKRAKYLGHVPYGCLISFLECDWTDIVSADILDTFKDEIERRRRKNRDKAAQEDRERIQAERLESASYHRNPARRANPVDDGFTLRYGLDDNLSPDQGVNLDDFIPLGAQATTPPNPRPGFNHLASMSTSPSTQKTVWGTRAIPISPTLVPRDSQRAADDGWLKDDQFVESLGAAELAVQMEALDVQETTQQPPIAGGGGKKKKKQKITLMSTGSRRGQ